MLIKGAQSPSKTQQNRVRNHKKIKLIPTWKFESRARWGIRQELGDRIMLSEHTDKDRI